MDDGADGHDPLADRHYMDLALRMAHRHQGLTGANPSVGCILVKDHRVVARAVTAIQGRPHAEFLALNQAGAAARGADAYVTLEPCAHEGETPACAMLLAKAGIRRVIIGCSDPDPRTAGKGARHLRGAGLEVVSGVADAQARHVHRGFLSRVERNRPWITLKLATSLDGRIAAASGESRWVTGSEARSRGWDLRARHDALLTGSGTVLADDPSLDCRLAGRALASPAIFVADRRGRLPLNCRLVERSSEVDVTILSAAPRPAGLPESLSWMPVKASADAIALLKAIQRRSPVNMLLIEAGQGLATAFLDAGLVDEIAWFRSGLLLGDGGTAAVAQLTEPGLAPAARFILGETVTCGADRLERWQQSR